VERRLNGPIGAAAGLNGGKIGPLQGFEILRQVELPKWIKIFGHTQAFETAVGTVDEIMTYLDTETSKVLGYPGEVIEF
jgi:hypothetical protein